MKCAYCGQPCNDRGYGNNNYEEYDVEMVNGMEITVRIHDKCLPKILGEWTTCKVYSPQYGPQYGIQYGYVPSVTCDTASETVKITKEGE